MNYTVKTELLSGEIKTYSYSNEAEAINAFCLQSDNIGSDLSAVFLLENKDGKERDILSAY